VEQITRIGMDAPFGREVLNRARRILHSVHDLEDFSEAQGYGLVGTIRLGVSPTLGPYILPGLVARLHREHPALRVHVREGLPDVLVTGLASGEHDIVLVQLPMPDRGFHVERLFREPLFLAMAADHPLRTKAMIEKEDLAGEQLLALQPGYRLAEQAAAIAEEAGAVLLRDYEGTSLNAVRQMAGMGMGLALLPQLYVRQEIRGGDDVIVRPFANGRYYREIGLLWRQGASRTPAFQTIAGYLREIG
jgi:LysR family transcriptional regulator, hydrogen peroxide-inducible genes activator